MYRLKAKCGKMFTVGLDTTVATLGLHRIVAYCGYPTVYTIVATISLKVFPKKFIFLILM